MPQAAPAQACLLGWSAAASLYGPRYGAKHEKVHMHCFPAEVRGTSVRNQADVFARKTQELVRVKPLRSGVHQYYMREILPTSSLPRLPLYRSKRMSRMCCDMLQCPKILSVESFLARLISAVILCVIWYLLVSLGLSLSELI